MKPTGVVIIVTVLLMAGCTPQVYSDLYTYEYAPIPQSTVKVLHVNDSIPEDALIIGRIIVPDKSTTTQSQYEKVLGLAVGEAARSGGNLLVVNSLPANGSKLQEWAKIARGYSSKLIPIMQPSNNSKKPTEVSIPETRSYDVKPTDTVSQVVKLLDIAPAEPSTKRTKFKQTIGSIKAGVGPIWTTSRLYIENDRDYETNVRGTGFSASVTTIRWGCTGIGMDFYLNHTTLERTVRRSGADKELSFTQFYIGPSFVCGGQLIDRLRGEVAFGLGLAVHSEKSQQAAGLGLRSSLGLEFMITPKFGIGIEGLSQRHLFKKPEGYNMPDDEQYGFQQLGVLFGLRTYF